jgi:hypothetical protein
MADKFTIEISQSDQAYLRSLFITNSGIKLHTKKKPGHIAPPEAMGLEYDYMPVAGTNKIEITITRNPFYVLVETVKTCLEADLDKILALRPKFEAPTALRCNC